VHRHDLDGWEERLRRRNDIDRWLKGSSVEDALALQKPAPNDELEVGPPLSQRRRRRRQGL